MLPDNNFNLFFTPQFLKISHFEISKSSNLKNRPIFMKKSLQKIVKLSHYCVTCFHLPIFLLIEKHLVNEERKLWPNIFQIKYRAIHIWLVEAIGSSSIEFCSVSCSLTTTSKKSLNFSDFKNPSV